MANIELVIKLDEEYIKQIDKIRFLIGGIEDRSLQINVINAIKNGTPLPKGHGRLIDGNKLKVELECGIRAGNYEEGYEKYEHINSIDDCVDAVEYADTIIEADKESEDK